MVGDPEAIQSDFGKQEGMPDFDLKKADYLLKERELSLKEKELDTKIKGEKRNIFLTSPLLIAVLSAIFGLLGTGIGAALQGYWNTKLESQKFESSLIQKAFETTDKNEAKRNLLFLVKAGLLHNLDEAKLEKLADNPDTLPINYRHQAVETGFMSIRRAKEILKRTGFYKGEISDANDKEFIEAVKEFQRTNGLTPDGFLGLATAKGLEVME